MAIREAITKLVERIDLSEQEAQAAMTDIVEGEATPAQIAAFATALRMKGETAEELAGLARVMRRAVIPVRTDGKVLDTAGTGGDGAGTFNISTVAAIVAAGAGARVAKHGNRAASSTCGSADLLEAVGVVIDLPPQGVEECIERVGMGFMFAPLFHPAMRHAVGPRREIGVRTVFNFLGPLTNPAGSQHQLMGVPVQGMNTRIAEVLRLLGSAHSLVVRGEDGLDELSISGPTQVHEVKGGQLQSYTIAPEELGLPRAPREAVVAKSLQDNVAMAQSVLKGEKGPWRDVVLLNASAALLAADVASSLQEGVRLAAESVDSGRAAEKLESLRQTSQEIKGRSG